MQEKKSVDGFHLTKDKWCQKARFGHQSKELVDHFEEALKSTRAAVPKRKQGYALSREPTSGIDESERERLWERSVFIRWKSPGLSPVRDCWDRLIAFQVPLFERREKRGWGYIDLLGIRNNSELCVIELKKEPAAMRSGGTSSSESPLRMVLEAAAYATALKERWPQFRKELIVHLKSLSISPDKLPTEADQLVVRLVGAAPAAYWIDWLPVTEKGCTVKQDDWDNFRTLLKEFARENMPVSFVSISGEVSNPSGLAAQPLPQFPLDRKASA